MRHLRFYFDPISPYAALAFARLPEALAGLGVTVDYVPVLFAGFLKAHGHKGPAEIPAKRDWTYRQVLWEAHRLGLPLQLPRHHPFNPLPLLRLCWATAPEGMTPSRWAVEQVFRHVWEGGGDPLDPQRLQALQTHLAPALDPTAEVVKQRLRQATDDAVAAGLFGVPTVVVDGQLFWGLDGLALLAAYLRGDPWFQGPDWADAARLPIGQARPGS
ncbi:2-hydroxychromene-2-carboxylate isomerase [Pelomonas sp. APW6]|uniref:2-hydroxychromene-2-carboxylate isomerase n=1 Tax=Roseateles subflavus TaxID=3053353 RepID=A0ABT7LN59_9BURK|nr:2-hydroxychromene-2-carboxylate isomerase [Pelomonas sp. APW6]MDL5034229.1 2-hydroxychromene-2-carboxylate isomerase [Pelomonas sp. APW6]